MHAACVVAGAREQVLPAGADVDRHDVVGVLTCKLVDAASVGHFPHAACRRPGGREQVLAAGADTDNKKWNDSSRSDFWKQKN